MEIIRYSTEQELHEAAERKGKVADVYSCDVSTSFRIYNERGNALEFHVFYKI